MIRNTSKNNGFSLIEVMLAVLVLAIGILAVSKLQTSLLRSGSDANHRSVAANIAQKKIDDLRRFVYINTSSALPVLPEWSALDVNSLSSLKYPNSLAFAHIDDDQGGRIQAGTIVSGDSSYTLSWTTNNYYYSDTANSLATTTAVTPYPAFKTAHVVVRWDGLGDNTNSVVSFDTVVDSYNLGNTDLSGIVAVGDVGPAVNYNPLAAPDVVPITLGTDDLKKETSKPLPDVSKKGDSTLVKFETVTYNIDNNTQRREEFRTLACNCTNQGTVPNDTIIKGYVTWDPTNEAIVDEVATITLDPSIGKTKVDNSGGEDQDDACTTCCRDGEDVVASGNTTFKVCRLKRIDGVLRILDPWKLVAFNMIPASYFNDSAGLAAMTTTLQDENIALYSSYVTTTVRDLLTTGSPSAFNSYSTVDGAFINDTTTFTNNSGAIDHLLFDVGAANKRDIQVRGVYMDYPPTGIYTQISGQTTYYSAANVPLDRVPFYEVNLTQLAGWIPDVNVSKDGANTGDQSFDSDYTDNHDDMDNTSCENTSSVPTDRNYVTNEEFFYKPAGTATTCNNASRGVFHPIMVTTVETVESRIFTGSDGVIDRNINTETNTTVDNSLGLKVE